MNTQLARKNESALPPILAGHVTPAMRERVEQFYFSLASLFEAWVTRRQSAHTQRAYREDVMSFIRFMGIEWPGQATALFSVSVKDVLAFREQLVEKNAAPKTINRRISSISSFYGSSGEFVGKLIHITGHLLTFEGVLPRRAIGQPSA